MKIENLEVGMIIKNYKELCEMLEIKVEAGNSKIAQLKELDRFVSYHKEGWKFAIDEVYKTPLVKIENRGGSRNNAEYQVPLEKQIMILLQKSKNHQICFPKYVLCRKLELINGVYGKYNYNQRPLQKMIGVTQFDIEDFYSATNASLTYAMKSTLKRLVNKKSISYQTVVIGMFLKDNISREISDEKTLKEILTMENIALEAVECESVGEAIYRNRYTEYKNLVNEQLQKQLGIEYIFDAHKVTSTKTITKDRLGNEYKNVTTETINEDFLERTVINIERRHKRADIPTICNLPHPNIIIRKRRSESYRDNNIKLANQTIKR